MAKLLLTGQRLQFGKLLVSGYTDFKGTPKRPSLRTAKLRNEFLAEIRVKYPNADYADPRASLGGKYMICSNTVIHNDWRPATELEIAKYKTRKVKFDAEEKAVKERKEKAIKSRLELRIKKLHTEAQRLGYTVVKITAPSETATTE